MLRCAFAAGDYSSFADLLVSGIVISNQQNAKLWLAVVACGGQVNCALIRLALPNLPPPPNASFHVSLKSALSAASSRWKEVARLGTAGNAARLYGTSAQA